MPVSIVHEPGGTRGRLTISYVSFEQLDELCRALSTFEPGRGDMF
jgi:hypothetical protein